MCERRRESIRAIQFSEAVAGCGVYGLQFGLCELITCRANHATRVIGPHRIARQPSDALCGQIPDGRLPKEGHRQFWAESPRWYAPEGGPPGTLSARASLELSSGDPVTAGLHREAMMCARSGTACQCAVAQWGGGRSCGVRCVWADGVVTPRRVRTAKRRRRRKKVQNAAREATVPSCGVLRRCSGPVGRRTPEVRIRESAT